MAQIKTLKDYEDNVIYPQSITKAIVDANGVDLDTLHQTFVSSAAIEDVENLNIEHESTSNKVLSINNNSTDVQYPSAKAVYDLMLANKDIGINMEVVDSLPTENIDSKTIYLVKTDAEGTYEMYVYVNEEWRQVGSTEVDLSNYATKEEIPTKTSQLTNDSGYATISQIPDVSGYATTSSMTTELNKKLNASAKATSDQAITGTDDSTYITPLALAGVLGALNTGMSVTTSSGSGTSVTLNTSGDWKIAVVNLRVSGRLEGNSTSGSIYSITATIGSTTSRVCASTPIPYDDYNTGVSSATLFCIKSDSTLIWFCTGGIVPNENGDTADLGSAGGLANGSTTPGTSVKVSASLYNGSGTYNIAYLN